jgi:hypothetical protein
LYLSAGLSVDATKLGFPDLCNYRIAPTDIEESIDEYDQLLTQFFVAYRTQFNER